MESYKKYADMIDMERPISRKHPQMSRHDRAAQFAPFAALTGYEDAIYETGRLTVQKRELTEEEKENLDRIWRQLKVKDRVEICYFIPDERKAGGAYRTIQGVITKLDAYQRIIQLDHEIHVPINDIYRIALTADN